ncbi:isoamylase early set domain-containing protein [Pontibacter locisalis]|uniref:Isoamylase early set domain-containing protein n=1 Tax=Pontibacter locisalis TaxID=1719035 RepID=A0ABW5IK25_9BACT
MITKTYLKTKDQCKVKFNMNADSADKAEIVGLNGDWNNRVEMKKRKDGSFVAEVSLPKNSYHEFKYLINGSEWRNDPDADGEAPNEYGETNSILTI